MTSSSDPSTAASEAALASESVLTSSTPGEKRPWRQQLRARRLAVPPDVRNQCSSTIVATLRASLLWQDATVIASYRAANGEVDLSALDSWAQTDGKQLVYPRVCAPGHMQFHRWQLGDPLARSSLGIDEPNPTAAIVAAENIDLFLVPLLGCDETGVRLGYGGGYYDRLLSTRTGLACGVGYDWQLQKQLPREDHDIRLDAYLSDVELIRFDNQ